MKKILFALIPLFAFPLFAPAAPAKIPVMLLDGEQGGPYHAWEETTPYLKRMLEDTGLFQVEVVTAPPAGADFSNFKPAWGKYKVVVANYDAPDERWPDDLKASFESYVRNGGGFVSVHAADNAFPKWRAYNQMIGIGGWRGRNESAGPFWYYKDGKLVSDPSTGPAGAHGKRLPFQVENRVTDHPITNGLPRVWMHVADELYAKLRGPGENMTVLSTAFSDPSNAGTSRDEPILMVINYGKGRVFHTVLGHDLAALNCVGFITTYQRGTEWAATGKVTQKVPADFPTADKTSTRESYNPPPGWVTAAAKIGDDDEVSTATDLERVLAELSAREPIFHRPEFGTSRADFESMTAEGFCETGASGRIYSRQDVLDLLGERHSKPHEDVWETSGFECRPLGDDTYLLTYTLLQNHTRLTRRSTIWRRGPDGWKIVYHQGTIVQDA